MSATLGEMYQNINPIWSRVRIINFEPRFIESAPQPVPKFFREQSSSRPKSTSKL